MKIDNVLRIKHYGTLCMNTNTTSYIRMRSNNICIQTISSVLTYRRRTRKLSIPYRECVESSLHDLILGDAFFRRWLVLHDLSDLRNKRIALAPIYHSYSLGAQGADTGGAAGPGGWVVQKLLARKNLGDNSSTHSQKSSV